ncbi:MAG: FIST C-terminal domain-containing protein [Candidatus Omnitrophica bacterium]|nr:FIST C-terminal domain-containing protein [Candidatus Omnitrophota bacterium]
MKLEQRRWTSAEGWVPGTCALRHAAHLVLVFGSTPILKDPSRYQDIRALYPNARVLGCSTAGEICGTRVHDDSVVTTAVCFDSTRIQGAQVAIQESAQSFQAGERVAQLLETKDLVHVLVISDGIKVNGSELVRGMLAHLPAGVQVTGGLSGDGARFEHTLVFVDSPPAEGRIAALGFYGKRLKIGYGSLGGWDPFGPERLITRSTGNILYELDGQPALALYKKYLGEHAAGLPATGLLFPLSVRAAEGEREVVRTILSVDEHAQSMTFAGDVPEGEYARLMKANFDRLVDGAHGAAKTSYDAIGSTSPDLAILISCVGRKLVLKQRTEEEIEAVRSVLGDRTVLAGFYSYGEICPAAPNASCELHNQTMTITTFSES